MTDFEKEYQLIESVPCECILCSLPKRCLAIVLRIEDQHILLLVNCLQVVVETKYLLIEIGIQVVFVQCSSFYWKLLKCIFTLLSLIIVSSSLV